MENPQNIRQVQLPSGKVIEVVYFAGDTRGPQAEADRAARAESTRELHVCPHCSSGMVYPVDWSEAGLTHWEVSLRCPECEWRATGVFAQDVVERFDIELDEGADALLRDLQQLTHANMADQIERFVRALNADQIVPADF